MYAVIFKQGWRGKLTNVCYIFDVTRRWQRRSPSDVIYFTHTKSDKNTKALKTNFIQLTCTCMRNLSSFVIHADGQLNFLPVRSVIKSYAKRQFGVNSTFPDFPSGSSWKWIASWLSEIISNLVKLEIVAQQSAAREKQDFKSTYLHVESSSIMSYMYIRPGYSDTIIFTCSCVHTMYTCVMSALYVHDMLYMYM